MRASRRKIPTFALYGEDRPGPAAQPPLHIEDIPSRSRKYLWTIDTHRHQELAQCVMVTAGAVRATLEDQPHALQEAAVFVVPPATVHSFQFSADTTGYVLTVHLTSLLRDVARSQLAVIEALFTRPRVLPLGMQAPLNERLSALLGCLLIEYRRPERLPDPIAASLAGAVLCLMAQVCAAATAETGASGAELDRLRAFRVLIEEAFLHRWPVARYARKLGHSETTLNRLCLRLTGHTAFHLIQQRVALEAQRRLIYSGASVSAVARELGFQDLAYFSRFYRRHHGMSPTLSRRRHGGGKVPTAR